MRLALLVVFSLFVGYKLFPIPYSDMQHMTVQVVNKRNGNIVGHCSGVYVGEKVLTAGHCKHTNAKPFIRTFNTRELIPAKWIDSVMEREDGIPTKDLGLLKVDLDIPEANVRCNSLDVGTRIFVVGMPRSLQWTVTQGNVTTKVPRVNEIEGSWVQMDVTVMNGNSGGPVFDRFGNVVGITSHALLAAGSAMGQINSPHAYAVSAPQICDFMNG